MILKQRVTQLLLSFVILGAGSAGSSLFGQENPLPDHVRNLNGILVQLHDQIAQVTTNSALRVQDDADLVIQKRAAALAQLAESDPKSALSLVLSSDLVSELRKSFPHAAGLLEEYGTWRGTMEHSIIDGKDFRSSRSIHQLHIGTETLDVQYAYDVPQGLVSGDSAAVSGVRIGNTLVASGGVTSLSTASTACSTTGVQNTVVLMVTFPGLTPPSSTTLQTVHDAFFGSTGYSLDSYWREASYGKASAAGNVFGWYSLSNSYTCSTTDQMRAEAIAMASSSGVNFQNYTRLFMVVPDMGCGWSGASTIGCTSLSSPAGSFNASTSYVNWLEWGSGSGTNNAAQVIFHEAGHALGLNHSRSRAFGAEAIGPLGTQGTYSEYGDGFTAMANGAPGHYDAPHKAELLNWLASSNYQVVQTSGTWTLAPWENPSGGLQALKVERGTGSNAWLWIEYRQPAGYDSAYNNGNLWSSNVFSGATIHYQDAYTTYEYSDLLDFSPKDSFEFYTPDLLAGQTWVDPYSSLSITVASATPSGLTVTVNYGATACTHATPTVTMSPSNPSVSAGSSVAYAVSVANHDSSGCSASTFSLNSSQPAGWFGTFNTPSLLVNPGQSASATLTESVPAGTVVGTYSVGAQANGNSLTGAGTANATVITAPTLTDTTSTSASSYSVRQAVAVTAKVMNGSVPAAGARVTFTLTKSNGTKVTGSVTADSNGSAKWSYKIGTKDPKGLWSVVNSATYNSQTLTSNTATFTVQ